MVQEQALDAFCRMVRLPQSTPPNKFLEVI
jgi:hypothetical protein